MAPARCQTAAVPYTLVSFHAHPDDEALLTAGTLARAAAEGHRVVLVLATAGGAGLAAPATVAAGLATAREAELRASARALGCARVELLGYGDSGMAGEPSGAAHPFAGAPVEEAAAALAAILRAEHADVLTVYDVRGGYGHPDHVQVHHVGVRAAALAGTPVVLEATVDRTALLRVLRLVARAPGVPAAFGAAAFAHAYTPRRLLTHRVDVRAQLGAKRAALAAHVSQAGGGGDTRTLAVLLRLPRRVFRRALGAEWFTEIGRAPGRPLLDDVFASLR